MTAVVPGETSQRPRRNWGWDWDCIVIGGGPAGLSAALTLGRACRRVLVLDDDDAPRNLAAQRSHGVLGHDGIAGGELRARGIRELGRYDVTVRMETVDPAEAWLSGDHVMIGAERSRTVIVATGLVEDTPAISGFDEIYGRSAHTCPYCDGWEHRGERFAALAPAADATHLGRLLRQWSDDVIVFSDPDDADARALAEAGIPVDRRAVAGLVSSGGRLQAIEMTDGSWVERDVLFFHMGLRPRTEIAGALGCERNAGGYLVVDHSREQTSADRVYAAGNCVNPQHNVPLAIADGVRAGVIVNQRLVAEDLPGVHAGPRSPH